MKKLINAVKAAGTNPLTILTVLINALSGKTVTCLTLWVWRFNGEEQKLVLALRSNGYGSALEIHGFACVTTSKRTWFNDAPKVVLHWSTPNGNNGHGQPISLRAAQDAIKMHRGDGLQYCIVPV